MDEQKKISLVEFVIFFILQVMGWLFDIFGDAMGTTGTGIVMAFVASGVSFCITAMTAFWFTMKGGIGIRKQAAFMIGGVMSWIPGLNLIPAGIAGFLTSVIMINSKTAQKIAGVAKGKGAVKKIAATAPASDVQEELPAAA